MTVTNSADTVTQINGTFTAVTQHDGTLPAADGFRFLGAASKWRYAKHIPGTEEKAETTIF